MRELASWTFLTAGALCLSTAILDAFGHAEWAPIGLILAVLFFWLAWMVY